MSENSLKCEKCNDTGWRRVSPDSNDVVRCECQKILKAEQLLKNSRIPSHYRKCTFASFEKENLSPTQNSAFDIASEYFWHYPNVNGGLLFMGPCGVGKTHLAVAIILGLMSEKGIPCLFYDFRELLREIRNAYNPISGTTETEVLEPVFSAEVLVLDELGAEKASGWVQDMLMQIINYRYMHRLPTIITTNYLDDKSEIEKNKDLKFSKEEKRILTLYEEKDNILEERIGRRLRSRMYEMCKTIYMIGEDFRKTKARCR